MISRRTLEVATAALTGAFGVAIVVSSLDIGVRWTSRGVGSGTFPLLAGVLIVAGSLYNMARALPRPGPGILDLGQALDLARVFVPAAVFIAAIPLLGLHVAAAVYMLATGIFQARMPVVRALMVAIATPIALWAIFDHGFSVTLPRGMLGAALGS
jgi:hypothetical protein